MSLMFKNRNVTALQLRISSRNKVLISVASRLRSFILRINRLLAVAVILSLGDLNNFFYVFS